MPLWLEEQLVSILIPELNYFVLNRGAVPRTDASNLSRIKRRLMEILPNCFVQLFCRVADIASDLSLFDSVSRKRKCHGPFVCLLTLKSTPVDGPSIDSGRRPRF